MNSKFGFILLFVGIICCKTVIRKKKFQKKDIDTIQNYMSNYEKKSDSLRQQKNLNWHEINKLDFEYFQIINDILSSYGWPCKKTVGIPANNTFWLILQHYPYKNNEEFRGYLEQLRSAVKKGCADVRQLAYFEDRYLIRIGKKQIYGTQLKEDFSLYPIEDIQKVDSLRLSIGLDSLVSYINKVKFGY